MRNTLAIVGAGFSGTVLAANLLAIVKALVELHGGTVEGFSAGPGTGSEFTIHLPRSAIVERR